MRGDLIIPNSVTTIGNLAFTGCSDLSKNIGFNTKYEDAEYDVDEEAFRITFYRKDTTIYAPTGTYGETYANTYGYSYVSELLLSEGEKIRLKEEEALQPLSDDYEQDIVIPEDKYAILVSDADGMAYLMWYRITTLLSIYFVYSYASLL